MSVDASASFSAVMQFLKTVFSSVLSWLAGIRLAGTFTLLDLNIAFAVFGIMFTLLFSVVRNSVNNSIGSVDSARSEAARDKKDEARWQRRQAQIRKKNKG